MRSGPRETCVLAFRLVAFHLGILSLVELTVDLATMRDREIEFWMYYDWYHQPVALFHCLAAVLLAALAPTFSRILVTEPLASTAWPRQAQAGLERFLIALTGALLLVHGTNAFFREATNFFYPDADGSIRGSFLRWTFTDLLSYNPAIMATMLTSIFFLLAGRWLHRLCSAVRGTTAEPQSTVPL